MDFQKEKQFEKFKANMDPPILEIKKEILEDHGDENSNNNGVLPVFVKEEMPVPRDTDLTQNDCTGTTNNGLADISHISKEDHAFAGYLQEVQDRGTKNDIDGQRGNIPGLGFEITKLWNLPLFSSCNGTNINEGHYSCASIKTEESKSLPDVSEADVKLEEPSDFSPTQTGQNSYLLSKAMKTVPDFHPATLDQLDSSQLNGDKVSDCDGVKKEVIEIIPESLNRSVLARSEKEENEKDMISPNNRMSCTALAAVSDQAASYGGIDDTLTHDNEFALVIDNAECDDFIKGKEAMDRVERSQFIFTTQRLKEKGMCCVKKRRPRTPASLTNERTVKKLLRNVKPKDRVDREDDDLVTGDTTSTLAFSNDVEEGSKSNTFEENRMSAEESRAASISWETDIHPCLMYESTFSTQSNQQRQEILEHNRKGPSIDLKERNLEHSLKQAKSIGTSVKLEAQPEDQRMNGMQMDDHVEKSMDLNDSDTFKQCKYNQSVLSDENFELANEIGCLLKHTITTRSREQLFKCEECDKYFNRKGNLNVHMRTHTGEKPFKCDECGKCFTFSGGLHVHMKMHTGEKPFKCNECEKCFDRRDKYCKHMRTHTGEKPYRCDTCGKCFSQKSNLSLHMRTHSREKPFKCDTCGTCFSQKISLSKHMRTHTGEKPYVCDQCGKCFSRSSSLHVHMKTHRRDKPFKSDECGWSFSHTGGLHHCMRSYTLEKTLL